MYDMFTNDQLSKYNEIISYLKNLIINSINNYVSDRGLASVNDISGFNQNKWYAVLMYVANDCMKANNQLLKADSTYINVLGVKCNNYNLYIIDGLYSVYSFLCNEYDKGITPYGFSLLLGIDDYTLSNICGDDDGANNGKLSSIKRAMYKKIYISYEQSAEARLWSNKNPVALMAITNRRFGWNMPGIGRETQARPALGASDLPQLGQKT